MPATRRSTGSTGASRSKSKPKTTANQSKLAFSNRVTKPNALDTSAKKGSPKTAPVKPEVVALEPEEDTAGSADSSLIDTSIEIPAPEEHLDPIDDEARQIKESQIKKFFQEREKSRKAPRVHQAKLSLHEKVLRDWDVDSGYGPCIGISRTKRWKRANKLGLNPPLEVLAVLIQEQDAAQKSERAHLDELMHTTS